MGKLCPRPCRVFFTVVLSMLCLLASGVSLLPWAHAQQPPDPVVAIHVSELTKALETAPAVPPTPTEQPYFSGYQWYYTSWRYFVAPETLKEAFRSDGTPFVEVSDSDIAAGRLLNADGSPRYPIMISLAAEAVADDEIAPLRSYVNAGGFLFVGSSSFTRYPNGSFRPDCALAAEMGVRMANSTLTEANNWNWYGNRHFAKTTSHRLTSHIPNGALSWTMPLAADAIPWGVMPEVGPRNTHWTWQVVSGGATVLANGDMGPYLAVKGYGQGQFIFHGAIQPLLGYGVTHPSVHSYFIYRNAVEWAFEAHGTPIVKLSPWRYPHDSTLLIRHDGEIYLDQIRGIKASAQFEHSLGAVGDYYFATGALRTYTGSDRSSIISSLRDAVSLYGATIGSHNGGLGYPDPSVLPSSYYYWHWGPDEVLDLTPQGYASGKAYASASILASFEDIEGWLAGTDNGRPGCGATGTCPRTWVGPFFNSTREGSKEILEELGSVSMGEQKIGPYPHWTLSYTTPGKRFAHISLPTSDWFVGTTIPEALEWGHTTATIRAAVDFYHNVGGLLLNYYGHQPSNNGAMEQQYVTYSMSKPRIWSANAVGIYDWWRLRTNVVVAPGVSTTDNNYTVTASVSGATDPETAIEVVLPKRSGEAIGNVSVYLNGTLATPEDYRSVSKGLKVRVGSSVSNVTVQYSLLTGNLPPVTASDTYSAAANTTLAIAAPGVLSNDSDPEGLPLSAQLVGGASHGNVTLNSNGSFVYIPVAGYVGGDSFSYVASDGVSTSMATAVTINIAAPTLSSLSLNRTSVPGGTSALGTVRLSAPAPGGGVIISLSDNSSAAAVPATVLVAEGSTTATFTISTIPVSASTTVTISALYGGVTRTATLTVTRPTLSGFSVSPTTVRGGTASRGTVTLSSPAPSGGVVVSLRDNSSAASVPATVTVPAGATSAAFTVTTSTVSRTRTVTLYATYGGVTRTAALTVTR